jgi:hypothetical protein
MTTELPLELPLEEVRRRMMTSITDADLERYFPETNHYKNNVIKYSELSKFKSLEELLPKDKSYKIILIEQDYNNGHWVCLIRNGDNIEEFDSYGGYIDDELKFVDRLKKKLLGEGRNVVTDLKKQDKKFKHISNKVKLQSLANRSCTCGRWVILRILMMRNFFYNLKEFQEFIKKYSKEMGLTPDELVAYWIV